MKGSSRPDLGSGFGELLERYPVTFGVLGANLVLFLFSMMKSGSPFFDPELLLRLGGNHFLLVGSQPWRLLASVFLHSGVLHFALNSVALYFVGDKVIVLDPGAGAPKTIPFEECVERYGGNAVIVDVALQNG